MEEEVKTAQPEDRKSRLPYVDLTGGLLAEVGKIKIGYGRKGGPPQKYDHFVITTLDRDEQGTFVPDRQIMQMLGENKRELEVMLPYDDRELNFPVFRALYFGAQQRRCTGDGVSAEQPGNAIWINADGSRREWACLGKDCPWATGEAWDRRAEKGQKVLPSRPKCKLHGILQVMLYTVPRIGGVHTFRTTSYYTIRSIQNSLALLHDLTRGNIAMIPLKMRFQWSVKGGNRIPLVTLYHEGDLVSLFDGAKTVAALKAGRTEELEALNERRRKALIAGKLGEDLTDDEIVQEFVPEAATEETKSEDEEREPAPAFDAEAVIRQYENGLADRGMDIAEALLRWGGMESEAAIREAISQWLDDSQAQQPQDAQYTEVEDEPEPDPVAPIPEGQSILGGELKEETGCNVETARETYARRAARKKAMQKKAPPDDQEELSFEEDQPRNPVLRHSRLD